MFLIFFLLKNASSVIIVPGYGMAVPQALHAVREMADNLKKNKLFYRDNTLILFVDAKKMREDIVKNIY